MFGPHSVQKCTLEVIWGGSSLSADILGFCVTRGATSARLFSMSQSGSAPIELLSLLPVKSSVTFRLGVVTVLITRDRTVAVQLGFVIWLMC